MIVHAVLMGIIIRVQGVASIIVWVRHSVFLDLVNIVFIFNRISLDIQFFQTNANVNSELPQETDIDRLFANRPKERLGESGVLSLIYHFICGDPADFRSYKKWLTSDDGTYGEWARNDSQRRAFDRAFKKSGMGGFFEYLSKHQPKDTRPEHPEDSFFQSMARETETYRRQHPNEYLSTFYEFVLSKADDEFTELEILMLTAVGTLEWALTLELRAPLILKDQLIGEFIPLEIWIPESNNDGLLSTTRYRVINHLLQNYMHTKEDSALQHLRGGPKWRQPQDWHKLRKLNKSLAKLSLSNGYFRTDAFDQVLDVLFHFAIVFEWFQLSLFKDGVSADAIVREFSKFPMIRENFYRDLQYFYKRKRSRQLYNHHV